MHSGPTFNCELSSIVKRLTRNVVSNSFAPTLGCICYRSWRCCIIHHNWQDIPRVNSISFTYCISKPLTFQICCLQHSYWTVHHSTPMGNIWPNHLRYLSVRFTFPSFSMPTTGNLAGSLACNTPGTTVNPQLSATVTGKWGFIWHPSLNLTKYIAGSSITANWNNPWPHT